MDRTANKRRPDPRRTPTNHRSTPRSFPREGCTLRPVHDEIEAEKYVINLRLTFLPARCIGTTLR